jgi:hypothetical protein
MQPSFTACIVGLALFSATLAASAAATSRQISPAAPTPDSGTIRIHLLGHAIGSERYATRGDGAALSLVDTFTFTDRGGKVELTSDFSYSTRFEPLKLRSMGRTYRFVNVDAEIIVNGRRAMVKSLGDSSDVPIPKYSFVIAGYAPLEMQALLVRYWETHDRPRTIGIVPGDPVAPVIVEDLGAASFHFADGRTIPLHRYSIDGVAWGREILYLDAASRFAAIVTRANLLPLEGVREDLAAGYS